MFVTQTKTFVTTKAELLDEYVNKWIEQHYTEIELYSLTDPTISYTCINGKGAYMITQQIQYEVKFPDPE